MPNFHSARHSHERNLEKSLERPAVDASGAAPARREGEAPPLVDSDVAGRLAREAAEREAARRGKGRLGGAVS